MRKVSFLILGVLIVSGITGTIAAQNLKKGTYSCPYYSNGQKLYCEIYIDKSGIKTYGKYCTKTYKTFTPDAVEKTCQYSPVDNSKYYSCEYADTTCQATFSPDGKTSYVSCDNIDRIPQEKRSLIFEKVKSDARANNCRNLNPVKPAQSMQKPKRTVTH